MNTFKPMFAGFFSDALSHVFLWLLGLLVVLAIVTGIIALASLLRQQLKPRRQAAPAKPGGSGGTEVFPRKCPQCGATLSEGVAQGLCPACVLRQGIGTEPGGPPGQSPFVAPSIEELARLFPQLEILGLLGTGGMGAVYKARQPALDRIVALKLLAPRAENELDFGSRFAREARALAKLNHPNIVAVYDFGTVTRIAAGTPESPAAELRFFIMEFVDGPNLRQVQQAGKLAPREALEIVPQICAALQYAHDEGVVHRDIKPENVLLDKKGRVKIADFGLAKIIGQGAGDLRLTGARDVMGTPHYMAPEQVERPQEVDHRADIYSLGVVFYELLTGELPLGRFQPPSAKVQVDVRLDEIVLRALAKEPQRRYQQASQLKTQVEFVSSTPASNAVPPPVPQPSGPMPKAVFIALDVLFALLLVATGAGAYFMGTFFNAIFLLMLAALPVYAALIVWRLWRGNLELRFWKNPVQRAVRPHLWVALNKWLFWAACVAVLELCIIPAQFTRQEYSMIRWIYLGAAALLVLLELLPGKRIRVATNLALLAGSGFMITQVVRIHWHDRFTPSVVLESPVRGEWVVANGGYSGLINIHFTYPSQRHAVDLFRVVNGRDRSGQGGDLDDYAAWDQPVFAPADGRVAAVVGDLPDLPIGSADENNPAGNHIILETAKGAYILLAHLKQNSVSVRSGAVVRAGEQIARVGNSGNTSQPHLHIQAQAHPAVFDEAQRTYPIAFRGAALQRGTLIRTNGHFAMRRNDRITSSQPTYDLSPASNSAAVEAEEEPEAPETAVAPRRPVRAVAASGQAWIELTALGPAAEGAGTWWHPDGTPRTNDWSPSSPVRPPMFHMRSRESHEREYQVVLKSRGVLLFSHCLRVNGEAVLTMIQPRWPAYTRNAQGLLQPRHVDPQEMLQLGTFGVDDGAVTVDCELSLFDRSSANLVEESLPGFQSAEPTGIAIRCDGITWNVRAQLQDTPEGARLIGSHPIFWNRGWDGRLEVLSGSVALSAATNRNELNHGSITYQHVDETFTNVRLEEISDVRFVIRQQERFIVRNVSLRPGKLTEVAVTNLPRLTARPADFKVERLPASPPVVSGVETNAESQQLPEAVSELASRLAAAVSMRDVPKRDAALAAIAHDAATAFDMTVVHKALNGITFFPARDKAIRETAKILVEAGHRAEAVAVSRKMTRLQDRDALLEELSKE